MSQFSGGLIKCMDCGKNYKTTKERKHTAFVCSGYSNYGKDFCKRFKILEEELIETVEKHLFIQQKKIEGDLSKYIKVIEVSPKNETYIIKYKDRTKSIISPDYLKF